MLRSKLLAGLAALTVLVGVVGSLVGLGGQVAANAGSLAVTAVVVGLMAVVVAGGLRAYRKRTPYW
jgi:hypothetical protein